MIRIGAAVGSLFVIATLVVGSLGVVATQTGCSGTCSADEEKKCTDTFTACTTAATTKAACEQCATSYCDCYDDCGNECKPEDHQPGCGALP